MDRKLLKLPFYKTGATKYQCPTCDKGVLKVITESFSHKQTKLSREGRDHDAWEPEWIEYVYSCLLECSNTVCKEIVSSTGKGSVTENYGYDEHGRTEVDYVDYFKPEYFTPHLKMFGVPSDIPQEVHDEINKSFSLLFADPASSANHIRVALEHLLTHLGIKRFNVKNSKRSFLTLHSRIDLLPIKYSHIKEIFIAVKWLGNAGSHSNHEVSLDDVLDSYELMSELLIEIFDKKRVKAVVLAKKINKKKGPK
jgi:hypothetical protein